MSGMVHTVPLAIQPRRRTQLGRLTFDVFMLPNGEMEITHQVAFAPIMAGRPDGMLSEAEKAEVMEVKRLAASHAGNFFFRIVAMAAARGWLPAQGH